MKLSFALILIASALIGSGTSESVEKNIVQVPSKPRVTEKDKSSTKYQENISDQLVGKKPEQTLGLPRTDIVKQSPTAPIEKTPAAKESDTNQERIWPPSSGWAIVYITAIYTLAAIGQLWAIYRQGNITQRAITHLERPWIIVKLGDPVGWDFPPSVSPRTPFTVNIPWSAINVGRSPAFLTGLSVEAAVTPLPPPNERPQYAEAESFAEMVIPPNGAHGGEKKITINDFNFQEIILQRACLMFYGFVRYHDTLREVEHTTRFCSYWYMQKPGYASLTAFGPVGPAGYIEYT